MADKKSSSGDSGKTGGNAKSSGPGFAALDRVFLTLGPSRTNSVGPSDLERIDKESRRQTKKSS
ncbi:MAG: hypothetical protein M3T56_04695 [Chloroflexota bacterium]|nr:hypothetical protein [Chloroflexota bacterium]